MNLAVPAGIVTLEDILEEIIGDIRDEFDEEETGSKKIDEHTYIFEGRTMIHDACKMMNLGRGYVRSGKRRQRFHGRLNA